MQPDPPQERQAGELERFSVYPEAGYLRPDDRGGLVRLSDAASLLEAAEEERDLAAQTVEILALEYGQLKAALGEIAEGRFFFCNKCGHMGPEGPEHPGCTYLAGESGPSRIARAALDRSECAASESHGEALNSQGSGSDKSVSRPPEESR